jgi:hypothetical protein
MKKNQTADWMYWLCELRPGSAQLMTLMQDPQRANAALGGGKIEENFKLSSMCRRLSWRLAKLKM